MVTPRRGGREDLEEEEEEGEEFFLKEGGVYSYSMDPGEGHRALGLPSRAPSVPACVC